MTPQTPHLDVVTFGEAMAMFVAEEPGQLASVTHYRRALAGAEVNVAVALSRLGHRVGWLGRVGDDPLGKYAVSQIAAENVEVGAVVADPEAPTGFQLKSRTDGQRDPLVVYYRRDSAGSRLQPSPEADARLTSARHLHMTGIFPALSAQADAFAEHSLEAARASGATISFDPNLRPSLWPDREKMVQVLNNLAIRSDWVLPGLAEGELLTGRTTPRGIADFYLERGVSLVAVKLGADGAALFTRDEEWCVPAFKVTVVDTVGAGDGFAAGLISGALNGLPLPARLERAAAVGALATTSPGDMDGMPTEHALDVFLTEQRAAGHQGPERIESDRTTEPAARQDRTAARVRASNGEETMRALVPWPQISKLMGGWPSNLKVDIYDGEQAPPEDLSDVAFYVMPYAKGNAPRDLIPRMTGLRAVQSLSAGVEKLLPFITPGVVLSNGRGLHDASVAEHALALVLAAQRDLPRRVHDQDAHRWAPYFTRSLADTRVVIVGYGSIGAAIEQRLLACEAKVVRVASRRRPAEGVHSVAELPELLPHADIVILTLPESPATIGLMDAELLALLPDDALVVNVGRGRTLDTAALRTETTTSRLRAVLDVTDPEPLPSDDPLWDCENVLITPHVGGGSATFYPRAERFVAEQLRRFAASRPLLNVVTTTSTREGGT
ncbi:PfkB family carbohydrate kinase [Streptomyces sp. NPDC002573]|uniref:PfkB family carbohydrate kinase n=1 Tax=Streptomyces sp. NPDC002573 TaxID=3364651 RepID=UPI0036CA0B11